MWRSIRSSGTASCGRTAGRTSTGESWRCSTGRSAQGGGREGRGARRVQRDCRARSWERRYGWVSTCLATPRRRASVEAMQSRASVRRSWPLAAAAMATVLACRASDALPGWPAAIAARSSISQSGLIGYTVNDPPSVQLLDGDGHPIVGVPVTFTLTAGGGALSSGVATTGSDGVATVGNWTVTAGTNTVVVSIPAPFRVAPVTFTATGEVQAFNIDLIFLTPAALAHRAVFDSAAGKWQRLIYGDIPNINVSIPAGACLGN